MLLDAELRDEAREHLLIRALTDEQAVDVRQPAIVDELLGGFEQQRLRLALLVRSDTADDEGVLRRRARVSLEALLGHLRRALELGRVRAVVDVGDNTRRDAHVLDDEVFCVLRDGDHAALVVLLQRPTVEVLLVRRIGRARLRDQKRLEARRLDALGHEGNILELASLLPNERHADLRRREQLGELGLEVARRLGDGLRVIRHHLGALDLLAILDDERLGREQEGDIVAGSLKSRAAIHQPQLCAAAIKNNA